MDLFNRAKPIFRDLQNVLFCSLVLFMLGSCILGGTLSSLNANASSAQLREMLSLFQDRETQWALVICLAMWCFTFGITWSRGSANYFWDAQNPDFWLAIFLFIGIARYCTDYSGASHSTHAVKLFGGAALGRAITAWVTSAGAARSKYSERHRIIFILLALIMLTLISSLWHIDVTSDSYYRGHLRSSGFWDNPNTFGLLMGFSLVLSVGLLLVELGCEAQSATIVKGWQFEMNTWHWLKATCLLLATGWAFCGLIHSYSRGAFLGVLFGIGCLFFLFFVRMRTRPLQRMFLKRNSISVAVISFSVLLLAFWCLRHSNASFLKRVNSGFDVNDFSWRNRVFAWLETLQAISEHPLYGSGWGRTEFIYDAYYHAAGTDKIPAGGLNELLHLGSILGIPALICFAIYVWLSLTVTKNDVGYDCSLGGPNNMINDRDRLTVNSLKKVCRGGAVVLVAGLGLDGGLFTMSTAAPFWVLLALGAI